MLPGPFAKTFYKVYPPKADAEFISVGWKEVAPGDYQVSVIYGRYEGDQPKIIGQRHNVHKLAESEQAFKQECEFAEKDYPCAVDASDKILAEIFKRAKQH